jgi:branched-chain amino acid transport system permease protein
MSVKLFKGWQWALLIVVLFIIPVVVKDTYILHIVNMIGIYSILAMSLNLVAGYCGQISLGHAAFYGLGAYTSAKLAVSFGFPFWLTIPSGGLFACLVGLAVGPILRLRGYFLVVGTLALGEIVKNVLFNWVNLTNGPAGINVPAAKLGSIMLRSGHSFYYVIALAVVLQYIIITNVVDSRVGRAMRAIRSNEMAASVTGISIARYKIMAFALSAGFAGIAGGLLGYLNRYISPHLFEFPTSVLIITMIVVGGLGNTKGAIAGAAMLLILSEALRGFGDYRLIIYSIMILLYLSFSPQGLVGITKNLWSFLQHKFKFEKFASTKFHLNK